MEKASENIFNLREKLTSLIYDYIDIVPEQIISGKVTHKCQRTYFQMVSSTLSELYDCLPDMHQDTLFQDKIQQASNIIDIVSTRKTEQADVDGINDSLKYALGLCNNRL